MNYKPEDVERLVRAVNEWFAYVYDSKRPECKYAPRQAAMYEALAPFRNAKPEKVVPPVCHPFQDGFNAVNVSNIQLHSWLIALEAKIDAIAEKVKD